MLQRGSDHDHLAPLHPWHRFYLAKMRDLSRDRLQQVASDFLMRHFAPTETEGDLDLVAALEKARHVPHLHVVIMRVDVRSELDLLDLDHLLISSGFGGPFLGLVFVLSEIHDRADGRIGIWRDLDQVEAYAFGHPDRVARIHGAVILALMIDEPDLGAANCPVDARARLTGRRRVMRSSGDGSFSCSTPLSRGIFERNCL